MRTLTLLCTSLLLLASIFSVGEAQTSGRTVIIDEIVCWPVVMPNGNPGTHVVFNPASVHFGGNCASTDEAGTLELFDEIAIAAIQRGLAEGQIICTSNCSGSEANVRIITAACVQRIGNGCATGFVACDPSVQAWRDYKVCCGNGNGGPTITLVGFSSPGCAGTGCESTVPPGGGSLE